MPPSRKLERIPPEIWQEIISRACTDGGSTGRALALTCKFFREQSLNARFYSLSLRSTKRLLVFLNSLCFLRKDCVPKIYHVLLAPSMYSGYIPRSLRHLAGAVRPGMLVDSAEFCVNAIEALFSLFSRQLRTLCLVTDTAVPFKHFEQKLPKLEELSLWNHPLCERPGTEAHNAGTDESRVISSTLFPALRRFHYVLTNSEMEMSFEKVIACLPLLAPKELTHLRLSGVSYADDGLPRILAHILGIPAPKTLQERVWQKDMNNQVVIPSGATFPHLRHIVIYVVQPEPNVDPLAISKWVTLLGLLRELERTCKRVDGMRMVVLERSWLRRACWDERLQADWVQRMDGGRGCWVESEVEESKIEGPLNTLTV